jgi:ATP-dependent DNA helicase RecG
MMEAMAVGLAVVSTDVGNVSEIVESQREHFGETGIIVVDRTQEAFAEALDIADSSDAAERLSALERTTDGFELAEVDLKLRGEGTILGARQKGQSDLTLASLTTDLDLLLAARELAELVTSTDPYLHEAPLLADELRVTLDPEDAAFLFKS